MIARFSKATLVTFAALWASVIAFNNMTDYNTNFEFVQHVFSMDTIFPSSTLTYRAITGTWLHHLAYIGIIFAEVLMACACGFGAYLLFKGLRKPHVFRKGKSMSMIGLMIGIAIWFFGFIVVGGEIFAMWQSAIWNGQHVAFNATLTLLALLIYLSIPE